MKWSLDVPKVSGWYWVVWKGYEYPELILVTNRENETYAVGQQYMIEPTDVLYWSEVPVERPELPWKQTK